MKKSKEKRGSPEWCIQRYMKGLRMSEEAKAIWDANKGTTDPSIESIARNRMASRKGPA